MFSIIETAFTKKGEFYMTGLFCEKKTGLRMKNYQLVSTKIYYFLELQNVPPQECHPQSDKTIFLIFVSREA